MLPERTFTVLPLRMLEKSEPLVPTLHLSSEEGPHSNHEGKCVIISMERVGGCIGTERLKNSGINRGPIRLLNSASSGTMWSRGCLGLVIHPKENMAKREPVQWDDISMSLGTSSDSLSVGHNGVHL